MNVIESSASASISGKRTETCLARSDSFAVRRSRSPYASSSAGASIGEAQYESPCSMTRCGSRARVSRVLAKKSVFVVPDGTRSRPAETASSATASESSYSASKPVALVT